MRGITVTEFTDTGCSLAGSEQEGPIGDDIGSDLLITRQDNFMSQPDLRTYTDFVDRRQEQKVYASGETWMRHYFKLAALEDPEDSCLYNTCLYIQTYGGRRRRPLTTRSSNKTYASAAECPLEFRHDEPHHLCLTVRNCKSPTCEKSETFVQFMVTRWILSSNRSSFQWTGITTCEKFACLGVTKGGYD